MGKKKKHFQMVLKNLISFKKVVANKNLGAVMTAHIVIPEIDSKPATLSYKFITEILRNELGFDGVVITDDIEMVSAGSRVEQAAVESILAGDDMIIDSPTPEKAIAIFNRLKKAVLHKEISEERIDQSVIRILNLKSRLINF
jgi:beta-N-acetylhexosaminidase